MNCATCRHLFPTGVLSVRGPEIIEGGQNSENTVGGEHEMWLAYIFLSVDICDTMDECF